MATISIFSSAFHVRDYVTMHSQKKSTKVAFQNITKMYYLNTDMHPLAVNKIQRCTFERVPADGMQTHILF